MAKKPSKKAAAKKPQATKKPARRYKATPAGRSDRQHLIKVIQTGTGCTATVARETMIGLLGTLTTSLRKNQRVQLSGFGTFKVSKRSARKGVKPPFYVPVPDRVSGTGIIRTRTDWGWPVFLDFAPAKR